MDDKLNAILNDPDKMKAAFEAASQFLGKNNPPASAPPPPATADLASMLKTMQENGALNNLMQAMSGSGATAAVPSADDGDAPVSAGAAAGPNIAQMLPQLMQMMGAGGGGVNSQRANLVNALKPYMKEGRVGSVDRAMNMASMAKNAKTMLGTFKK